MVVNLSLTGVEQIDAVLRGFPDQFNHRVLGAAHAEAARPMVTRMHLLAPVGRTGRTADSVGTVKMPFSKAATIGEVQVGPRRGRFGGSKAHFSELGTRSRSFNGANRGVMPKKPWIEPAFEQTNVEVLDRIPVILGQKAYSFMRRTIKNG